MVLEELGDDIAEGGRLELFLLTLDIMSVEDSGYGRGVGGRSADAVPIKRSEPSVSS